MHQQVTVPSLIQNVSNRSSLHIGELWKYDQLMKLIALNNYLGYEKCHQRRCHLQAITYLHLARLNFNIIRLKFSRLGWLWWFSDMFDQYINDTSIINQWAGPSYQLTCCSIEQGVIRICVFEIKSKRNGCYYRVWLRIQQKTSLPETKVD